ncbi:MAG: protein kinase, partial [Clostridia bacterium]|nr:protein kinase [Clostridia bacterium]
MVGTVLENRYEILEMIGSGGMATVYKAKCRVLNRYVAIKVLKDSLKYDSDVVKRFNAEARAAAGLSHPHIVQVYDVSEKGGL